MFILIWENDHNCGELGRFKTRQQAHKAGQNWKEEMVLIDENPKQAREEYDFTVIEEGRAR